MKTTLIVLAASSLSAFVAYQAGQWRQHTKDTIVFKKTISAVENVLKATTMEEALDVVTTFEMDLKQF